MLYKMTKKDKSTTEIGSSAETLVANYLKEHKHSVLALNWRTRWCEIDIVSKKDQVVYFTEVKYRKVNTWGSGLEAITNNKLKQMKFAAEIWLSNNKWSGEARLQAAAVYGEPPILESIIELD